LKYLTISGERAVMSVIVKIPIPYKGLIRGERVLPLKGKSIRELIKNLEEGSPGVEETVFNEGGNLKRYIKIFVNRREIAFLDGLKTILKDGDKVVIILAVGGG